MATVQQAFQIALEHHCSGRLAEAEALYRQILAVQPDHVDALHHVGLVALQSGRRELAVDLILRAIAIQPNNVAALSNLGEAYRVLGRFDDAAAAYRQALQLNPDHTPAWNNLGIALRSLGQNDEAVLALRHAIRLDPQFTDAHYNLGNALKEVGPLDEAEAEYRRALELQPDHLNAQNNLGLLLSNQGRLDDALEAFRRALRLDPKDSDVHSNLILTLHFLHGNDRARIREEQKCWSQSFGGGAPGPIPSFANVRDPGRRLRIGYVSPDFRKHAVGFNLLPLFANHDNRDFEILCYSGVGRSDEMTDGIRERAAHWRSTVAVADDDLVEMIRADGVDVLVDLSQHSGGNRLPVFARRPAPVQVSFAGYPESTGLAAIEYRISDRWMDAEPGDRRSEIGWNRSADLPTERVFLLDSFWCYDPCGASVAVNELPATERGTVTFGCLNNFCKITEPQLMLWARVLKKVEDARLVLLARPGNHCERTTDLMEREGVARQRVEFVEPRERLAYLELYHRLDIVLDTFPYNGHTTSLDALWMGVPVVTLAGECAVTRAGLSQLSNLDLPELVATTEDAFVEISVGLARDLPRVAELRRTLRERMETSVLMNGRRFARDIEAAYRAMWTRWCAEAPASRP